MKLIAGVDIGNSTTEVCIASLNEDRQIKFLGSGINSTTGIKGTVDNVVGIIRIIEDTLSYIGKNIKDLSVIRINEAAPVIGDTAMETITETIITESTMIGHNPSTPGGVGLGVGKIICIQDLRNCDKKQNYILIVPKTITYDEAANMINKALNLGIKVVGAIVQKDEGVLINNRLKKVIPIVDEVKFIDKIPVNMVGAVEVADASKTIKTLSNPFGIASIFNLTSEETRRIVPVAKSLIGIRSAVVIKTPKGEVKEKIIPSGTIFLRGKYSEEEVDVDLGAEAIMKKVEEIDELKDAYGEPGTNIGGMLNNVKVTMANLTGDITQDIQIKDILAIDTNVPVEVQGALAGETSTEKAVAVAAMVKTDKLPMQKIAEKLQKETGVFVKIAGVEATMAVLGAMTTPGIKLPLAILDLGGGSTDAALITERGEVKSIHLAGAGELITMLINSELGLNNRHLAEDIKRNPIAKVESLFHIQIENGETKFFKEPLDPKFFGRVVIVKENDMIPIPKDISMEKIVQVRKEAKKRIFVKNAIRALKIIAPFNNLRDIPNVVLVGGSALDFEIPAMILESLSNYKIVAGRGNIRKTQGPRNAVATGLILSYIS